MHKSRADILALPEEIYRKVLELLDGIDDQAIIRFSHTCRKFREVALSFPKLWTTIGTMMGIPACEAYLTRSQGLPLNVELNTLEQSLSVLQQYVRTIFQHAHRIKTLSVHVFNYGPEFDDVAFLEWLRRDAFQGIELPLLESLGIHAFPDDGVPELDFYFADTWSMPRLRAFCSTNLLPGVFQGLAQITSLSFSFDAADSAISIDTSRLVDFLRNNPQLQKLSFRLTECSMTDYPGPPVIMENLESFQIRCHRWDFNALACLMKSLRFPNLVSMHATLGGLSKWDTVPIWLSHLFGEHIALEKLSDFTMLVYKDSADHCGAWQIFNHLPNLKNLSIGAINTKGGSGLWDHGLVMNYKPIGNLETVKLVLDKEFRNDAITSLLKAANPRRLEFQHSPSFSRDKIDWSPYETEVIWRDM